MKRKILLSIAILTLVLFSISSVMAAGNVDLGKAPKKIKIGATFSITGRFAGFYKAMGEWEDALVQVINERGGLYVKELNARLPIEVVWYDDKSDPATVTKFYEKFVTSDKVDFLIGATASPPGIASSNVAEKYKVPVVLTSSNDISIFNRGFKWITMGIDTGLPWSKVYFEMIKGQTDAKTVALLTEDTIWPRGIREGAVDIIKGMGLNLVFDKMIPADTKDFTPVIVELKKLNADVLYVPSFAPFFATFIKQALTQKLEPKALHGSAGVSVGFLEAMGTGGANYITGDHYWVPGMKYEGYELMEEIYARSKIDPLEFPFGPPCNFASHQILFKAIEAAGTLDRNKVQETMEKSSFGIIGGLWHRQPNGAGTYNPYPLQNLDGKPALVAPANMAQKKFVYPIPWK